MKSDREIAIEEAEFLKVSETPAGVLAREFLKLLDELKTLQGTCEK